VNRPGEIQTITVMPINAAMERSSGIDLSGKYQIRTADYGNFSLSANYSKVLSKKSKQFDADSEKNDLTSLDNTDWPDKLIASLNWSRGDWSDTLTVTRYGKVPNAAQTAYLTPTGIANFSTVYKLSPQTSVSFIVNNVLDTIKRDTSDGWPNYPVGSFSPLGRQIWLELNHRF